MFGLFKNKEPEKQIQYYEVDFDKIETLEELREVVRGLVSAISPVPRSKLRVPEDRLENYPVLKKIVVKEKNN